MSVQKDLENENEPFQCNAGYIKWAVENFQTLLQYLKMSPTTMTWDSESNFHWDNQFTLFLVIGCAGVGLILLEISRF